MKLKNELRKSTEVGLANLLRSFANRLAVTLTLTHNTNRNRDSPNNGKARVSLVAGIYL